MGNVTRLPRGGQDAMAVTGAVDKYLFHVHATKSARTWRAYGLTFQKFCGELDVAGLDPDRVAEWFAGRCGKARRRGGTRTGPRSPALARGGGNNRTSR